MKRLSKVCALCSCVLWLPLGAVAADKHIDVSVRDGQLVFTNSACASGEPGCVEVERNNSPMIRWELDRDSEAGWKLTGLRFSPDGEHWGVDGHPLASCTVDDFLLTGADRYSGWASTARVTANGKRLQIFDHNLHECLTHYRLYAQDAAGNVIHSHPVIDNKGTDGR